MDKHKRAVEIFNLGKEVFNILNKLEIWRDVPNYEGLYKVSNLGNVKSLNYGKKHILKPAKNNKGYLLVTLCKNGKPKKYLVHRLVALTFLPNPLCLKEINHINEDKTDNRLENLEWCDRKYNNTYGNRIKKSIQTIRINNSNNECYKKMIEARAKKSSVNAEKPVVQYTKDGIEIINTYKSAHEAERQTGIPQTNICSCCRGKLKSAGNYLWHFL